MPPPEGGSIGQSIRERVPTDALTGGWAWLYRHPRTVVAGIAVGQWLAVLAFALNVRHNGWVYYQGGDQIWYTTSAWLVAHGDLPPTFIGYGWVMPLIPLAWLAGPEYTSFLPGVIALNVLVLGPVALACVYGIATRIGGRALGLYASLAWAVAPFLAIPLFREDYHDRYVEQFLPQALGLTALADYPSMICLLVAALLLVRAVDAEDWTWAALAGLAAGVGASIKPANLIFFAGPALVILLSRRWRIAVPYAAGLLPPLVLLALWKFRGLGTIPAFALEETRIAASNVVAVSIDRYIELDWDNFRQNMANLREFFYSVRVVQWIPIAGTLAVARRSLPLAGLLAGWLAAFLVFKATAPQSTVESGSFFRLLMPAFPAYFLLFAALPLLVPGVARRSQRAATASIRPVGRRTLITVGVLFVALPLVAIAAPNPISAESPKAISINTILTPVDERLRVTVRVEGAQRRVTWTHPELGGSDVFYRVFRTAADGADVDCIVHRAAECRLEMLDLGTTREPRFVDLSPPEDALYRIGIATNWENNSDGGDVIVISPPIAATP